MARRPRRQHTIYLSPSVSQWVRMYAAERDVEISEIIEQALVKYRESL